MVRFPYNQEFWFQHGVGAQRLGDLMVNRDLGKLIRYMMEAEAEALASGGGRSEGIRAAREAFYAGAPARVGPGYSESDLHDWIGDSTFNEDLADAISGSELKPAVHPAR